jgi:hypothetical protein
MLEIRAQGSAPQTGRVGPTHCNGWVQIVTAVILSTYIQQGIIGILSRSFDRNLAAGLLKLLLDGLRLFLGDVLLDRLGSTFDERLRFGEAEAG